MKNIHFLIFLIVFLIFSFFIIRTLGSIPQLFKKVEESERTSPSQLFFKAYRMGVTIITLGIAIVVCYWMYAGKLPGGFMQLQEYTKPLWDMLFGLNR